MFLKIVFQKTLLFTAGGRHGTDQKSARSIEYSDHIEVRTLNARRMFREQLFSSLPLDKKAHVRCSAKTCLAVHILTLLDRQRLLLVHQRSVSCLSRGSHLCLFSCAELWLVKKQFNLGPDPVLGNKCSHFAMLAIFRKLSDM
jgi:hypothetical protein